MNQDTDLLAVIEQYDKIGISSFNDYRYNYPALYLLRALNSIGADVKLVDSGSRSDALNLCFGTISDNCISILDEFRLFNDNQQVFFVGNHKGDNVKYSSSAHLVYDLTSNFYTPSKEEAYKLIIADWLTNEFNAPTDFVKELAEEFNFDYKLNFSRKLDEFMFFSALPIYKINLFSEYDNVNFSNFVGYTNLKTLESFLLDLNVNEDKLYFPSYFGKPPVEWFVQMQNLERLKQYLKNRVRYQTNFFEYGDDYLKFNFKNVPTFYHRLPIDILDMPSRLKVIFNKNYVNVFYRGSLHTGIYSAIVSKPLHVTSRGDRFHAVFKASNTTLTLYYLDKIVNDVLFGINNPNKKQYDNFSNLLGTKLF